MNIPDSVKLMDSGLAMFSAASREDAVRRTAEAMLSTGRGRVEVDGSDIVLDFSDLWRNRFITARIEESCGGYAASFKEADSPGVAFIFALSAGLLLCLCPVLGAVLPWSALYIGPRALWWAIPAIIAIGLAYAYLYYAPSRRCIARMRRLIAGLQQPTGLPDSR